MSKGSRPSRRPTARQVYFSPLLALEDQEVLEREFFCSLRLRNGTYKDAYTHRLDDLNDLVNSCLPSARPLRIMDVAISSGISTLEWIESLRQRGIEHEMVGSDLTINAYLVSLGQYRHALVDEEGYPLQFEVQGEPLPNPTGKRLRARHFLSLLKIDRVLRHRFRGLRDECVAGGGSYFDKRSNVSCRRIALVSPRLGLSTGLATIEDDILSARNIGGSFHVLRAANILNRAYFDDDTLAKALCNLRRRLLPNGLFIVCRTDEHGTNNATVLTLDPSGRFEVVARLNVGSEVEDVALGLLPDAV